MKIYLVGGAVRDKLLHRPVTERDYVVVGATPEEMIKQGFKPVGKEFPVFLHPETKEEYALARTERKIAKGYKGFEFYASPDVTLEEDLKRRDLTINAMAETLDGKIIDPFHGQQDLQNKILKHVSEAFAEDPVRILRLARFAARFPDFKIHPETLKLMQQMVKAGEVDALVAERVWQELAKALQEKNPQRFFEVLQECAALEKLFPSFTQITDQIVAALKKVSQKTDDPIIKFAAMFYAVNKEDIEKISERFRIPAEYRELALLMTSCCPRLPDIKSAEDILNLLERTDAFRRPKRFEKFLIACGALSNNEKIFEKLRNAYRASAQVGTTELLKKGYAGKDLGEELRKLRMAAIEQQLN